MKQLDEDIFSGMIELEEISEDQSYDYYLEKQKNFSRQRYSSGYPED